MSAPYYADDAEIDYSSLRLRDRRESDHDSRRTSQPRYARSRRRPTASIAAATSGSPGSALESQSVPRFHRA